MNNENSQMTVGCIRTTTHPPLASGIYEALMEQAQRERDEAIQERERWKMQAEQKWGMRRELEELLGVKDTQCDEQFAKGLAALRDLIQERDEAREQLRLANIDFFNTQAEVEEQARLLGMGGEREARLITERDHYKQAVEHISTTIDDWLNSLVQEPPDDFIHAIKDWADKKLKEI